MIDFLTDIIRSHLYTTLDSEIGRWYQIILKKVFYNVEKKCTKSEADLAERWKLYVQQHYGVSFYKKKFLLMIYLADRAILMSIFDNDQISSKLAQT